MGKSWCWRKSCKEQILPLKEWWSNVTEETEENKNVSIWDAWTLLFWVFEKNEKDESGCMEMMSMANMRKYYPSHVRNNCCSTMGNIFPFRMYVLYLYMHVLFYVLKFTYMVWYTKYLIMTCFLSTTLWF